MGYSVPHNKELMRIFRDLDVVEQMGSGIPRILQKYKPSVYIFTANFIRVVFPFAEGFDDTPQVERVLQYCSEPRSRVEIQAYLGFRDREHFRKQILLPLIESGQLLMTMPDKPTSSKQKFYTVSATEMTSKNMDDNS